MRVNSQDSDASALRWEKSEDGVLWHVLQTKPRQEKILAADLAALSIDHYLPLRTQVRHHGNRKLTSDLPVFPGYLFLRGTLDEAYQADRTKRVAQLIRVAEQEHFEWELRNLRLALDCHAPLNPYPYLVKGVCVEVRSGPFRGLQGVIEERARDNRLLLQMEMLGRALSLEIDGSLLEPIDQAVALA